MIPAQLATTLERQILMRGLRHNLNSIYYVSEMRERISRRLLAGFADLSTVDVWPGDGLPVSQWAMFGDCVPGLEVYT